MPLTTLDHVNVRTSSLEEMTGFYRDALGMQVGDRPPFSFGGAWMYVQGHPVVHLVQVAEPPEPPKPPNVGEPRVEHFAFRAHDLPAFIARLQKLGVEYRQVRVPAHKNPGNTQIFLRDPDDNRIEIQFDASEMDV